MTPYDRVDKIYLVGYMTPYDTVNHDILYTSSYDRVNNTSCALQYNTNSLPTDLVHYMTPHDRA